ncbi:MAG: methyltransferase domain-containing protein [Gaiellales bacterium]
MSASPPRPAHGAGSSWDTPEAVERVASAYRTRDVVAIRQLQIDLLGPLEGAAVLDIGCGPGIYARDLAQRGARVTAIDSAPAMLAAAEAEARAAGVAIELATGDASALPFPDASFDAAVLVQVIEYVPDAVGALREIARVLRPGGRLLVCDTDWATGSWGIGDADLAERIKRAWCDTKEHFDAGRRIPEWLVAAGYAITAWDPQVLANADAVGDTFLGHSWKTYRRTLERLGTVSADDLDRFDRLCAETTAAGTFTFTVVRHAWLARTPGGSP